VMPDGLVVWHDSTEGGSPLEVDLNEYEKNMTDRSMAIYLAVAASSSANSNGNLGRYESIKGSVVPDEVSGGAPHEIYRLKPRLSLLVTDALPQKYVGFPLTKVRHTDSAFTFDDEFIPPLLSVPVQSTPGDAPVVAAARLANMCAEAAEHIRNRAKYLAHEDRAGAGEGETRSEATTRQMMLSLVGGLPSFEALLRVGVAHPLAVYLGLCAIAGPLAVLGKEMVPDTPCPYDHNDLYSSFKPLLDFIDRALDQGVPVSYKSFPFRFRDGVFQRQFDGAWMSKRLAIGIKGPHEMSPEDVVKWGESCLIGAEGKIEAIREKRIRGAERMHAQRVGDIVAPKGEVLFSLKADAKFIEPDKQLQIFNTGTWPREIVLYVTNE